MAAPAVVTTVPMARDINSPIMKIHYHIVFDLRFGISGIFRNIQEIYAADISDSKPIFLRVINR